MRCECGTPDDQPCPAEPFFCSRPKGPLSHQGVEGSSAPADTTGMQSTNPKEPRTMSTYIWNYKLSTWANIAAKDAHDHKEGK